MDANEVLDIVLREMTAYGRGWRYDWSDFDGRQLRDQLNELAAWADETLKEGVVGEYIGGTEFEKNRG